MCKAIEDMRMQEREEGREEGRIGNIVESVKNLMESTKWTLTQTMEALKISDADKAIVMKML